MKIFLIIFTVAILFVIGSASALRYFGNPAARPPEKPEKPELPDQKDK